MRSSADHLDVVNAVASVDGVNVVDAQLKDKLLVVSVDYDSCFSGPRFKQALLHIEHLKGQGVYKKSYLDIIGEIHMALINDIVNKAKAYDCTRIKVMIGSNRQALELDARNLNNNNNGSCFDGMAMLAAYLATIVNIPVEADLRVYADALMDKPDGHHANVYFQRAEMGDIPEEAAVRMHTLKTQVRDHKYCLSFLQATNACLENPDSEVVYQFYDDLTSILDECEQQFRLENVADYLPSNLRAVIFSRYQDTIALTEVVNIEEKIRKLSGESARAVAVASPEEVRLVHLAAQVSVSLAKVFNAYLTVEDVEAALASIRSNLAKVSSFHEKVVTDIKEIQQKIHHELSYRAELVELLAPLSTMLNAIHPDYAQANLLEYIPGKEASGYLEDMRLAVERGDNEVLCKIFMDPNLMHNIRMSVHPEGFTIDHAMFKQTYKKLKEDEEGKSLTELNVELATLEAEKSAYENMLRFLNPIPDDVIESINQFEKNLDQASSVTYDVMSVGIEALNRVTYLLDSRSQPKIMIEGRPENKAAIKYGCGVLITEIQGICDRHREMLYLDNDKMLTPGKEVVVHPVATRPVTNALLGGADSASRVVACLAPAVWQGADALPSLQVLHGRANRSRTEIVQMHFAKCDNNKTNFLATLRQLLQHKDCNRATIIAFFEEFKNRDGQFAYIHANKNQIRDAIRFKFKSNRNSGQDEHTFWHTGTFSDAVKLLKVAYVALPDDVTATAESGNLLIDYHRGNKIAMAAQTKTRKMVNN